MDKRTALRRTVVIQCDQNRTIKFRFVGKLEEHDLLNGDNFIFSSIQNFQIVTAINAFRHMPSNSCLLALLQM